jgi:hypothetical protein
VTERDEFEYTVRCRARIADGCLEGEPTTALFGEDLPMAADGSYEVNELQIGTVVCDPCFELLRPLTPSRRGYTRELDAALAAWRESHGNQ